VSDVYWIMNPKVLLTISPSAAKDAGKCQPLDRMESPAQDHSPQHRLGNALSCIRTEEDFLVAKPSYMQENLTQLLLSLLLRIP